MNAIADFDHHMVQVGGPLIFLAFLAHFVLYPQNSLYRRRPESPWAHAKMLKHRDTWLWMVQIGTAMIILILGAIHMWVVLTDLPITAWKSAERMRSDGWLWFCFLLLPLVEMHVSIGAYRIAVKWGFIQRANRPWAKRWELYMFAGFIVIGFITILRLYYLAVPAAMLPS